MIYVALLDALAAGRIQSITAKLGRTQVVSTATELVQQTYAAADSCAILDPTLITRSDAEHIAEHLQAAPHTFVVYAPIAREALETSVILARKTTAHFVFHGVPNERAALSRILLLAPDASVSAAVVEALAPQLAQLPTQLRLTIATVLRTVTPPTGTDALAAQAGLPRRTMDRALEQAGLQSSRFFVAAARVLKVYRAVTGSRLPFRQVAAMAGYGSARTLDDHFVQFFGCSTTWARLNALPPTDAVALLTSRLTTRDPQRGPGANTPSDAERSGRPLLSIHRDGDERTSDAKRDVADDISHDVRSA